jgi:hypothetical protein
MTDSQSALSEVPALLEERRRYESWLVALEGRRQSTPQHVFDRVHTDYRTRLERVADKLLSYRGPITEERANQQSRLSLLEAEEGRRRDERSELELRSHVGELIGADADTAFGSVDQVLEQLVDERERLVKRISELGTLLAESSAPSPALQRTPSEDEDDPDETAVGAHVAADSEPRAPLRLQPREPHSRTAAPELPMGGESSVDPPRPWVNGPVVLKPAPSKPVVPMPSPTSPGVGPTGPALVPPRPAGAQTNFDELAFLSSVVGKNDGGGHPAGRKEAAPASARMDRPLVERRNGDPAIKASIGIVQDENTNGTLLAGVENGRFQAGEHPLAVSGPSNPPIMLRPATALEQGKTLRCNECGGMNYPTEWYCERCGGELAAL